MKKKELGSLRSKSEAELNKLISEKEKDFLRLSAEIKAGKEKNLKSVKNIRRDISQLKTVLRELALSKIESSEEK